MLFTRVMQYTALLLYTVFTSVLLVYFEANVLWMLVFLSGVPMLLLWWKEKLASTAILILSLVAIAAALVLGVVAYINGVWYEISPTEIRLFDLLPIESFIAALVHMLYFVMLYEFFFDDRKTKANRHRARTWLLFAGVAGLISLALGYLYIFSGIFLTYPFVWLVVGLVLASVFVIVHARRRQFLPVLYKSGLFAAALFPLSLAYEYVSLENNLRFFANYNEYLYTFTIGGQVIPLEELLFIFLIPLFVSAIYELYFDDGK